MQRQRLCTALLLAIGLTACSTAPEQASVADALVAPPPPAAPPAPVGQPQAVLATAAKAMHYESARRMHAPMPLMAEFAAVPQPANTEHYAHRDDNPVHRASEEPVSTFSIDV